MSKVARRDLGWLEGLIDGEGCLSLYKTKRETIRGFQWYSSVVINNTDRRLLEHAQKIIGGGHLNGPYRNGNPNWKPIYMFRIGPNLQRKWLPRLHLITKEQHRLLLIETLSLLSEHIGRNHGVHDSRLEQIFLEFRKLNRWQRRDDSR